MFVGGLAKGAWGTWDVHACTHCRGCKNALSQTGNKHAAEQCLPVLVCQAECTRVINASGTIIQGRAPCWGHTRRHATPTLFL